MLKYHLQNIFSKPDFIKINSELKWYKEIGHDQIPYKFPYNWLNFESLGARDGLGTAPQSPTDRHPLSSAAAAALDKQV